MINRVRFNYSVVDMISYVLRCVCIRRFNKLRYNTGLKVHYMFKKSEEMLNNELDVISLMKKARQSRLLTQIVLNQKQKTLLRF